jgi:hypothetical protein
MGNRDALPADAFYAQFHHSDEPHHHSSDHPTREWWGVHDDVPEAVHGAPVSYARGGTVKGDDEHHGKHPALSIPGIHIVTADAGEPTFTGER